MRKRQRQTDCPVITETAVRELAKSLSGICEICSHIAHAIRAQDAVMQKRFGGRLSEEQRAALHHILGPSQLACVVGLAGAGKSTM